MRAGDKVRLSGDSKNLWIKEYNVRVDTVAMIIQKPQQNR